MLALGERYRIRPAKDWWEDGVQVEALAALAAWVERYDSGEWDDPPGKLSLLYDLERVRELIRGSEPFHPDRDRAAFSPLPDRRGLPATARHRLAGQAPR